MRWLHHLWADLFGYFWLPCPVCGKHFGGHEQHGFRRITASKGEAICKSCALHPAAAYDNGGPAVRANRS